MKKFTIKAIVIFLLINVQLFAQQKQAVKTVGGKQVSLHKVVAKETWSSLSRQYNMSIDELKSVNPGIKDLKTGQIINVPVVPIKPTEDVKEPKDEGSVPVKSVVPASSVASTKSHKVEKGETLYGIARKYNVKADEVKQWNNLKDGNIKLGQVLKIKFPSANSTSEPLLAIVEQKKETTIITESKPASTNTEVKKTASENKTPVDKTITPKTAPDNVLADASNKIIPITPVKEEVEYAAPIKKEVRRTGKDAGVVEMSETGMASWIRDGELNQSKFYALHRTAPPGTIIKVTNRMNGDYVFVKVVGQLPDTGDNDKQIVKISEAAAKRIGAINEKFQVELSYGIMQ